MKMTLAISPPLQRRGSRCLRLALTCAALLACQGTQNHGGEKALGVENGSAVQDDPSLFDPRTPFARPALCDRAKDDAVRDIFCKDPVTPVRSLRQLEQRLSLSALRESADDAMVAALEIDPYALFDTVVYLGHSTALSGRLVSPINPRAILLGKDTFLAYQRGVQQVEVVTTDRDSAGLNFYLVSFAQACNDKPNGCSPGDLYTPQVERDWVDVALRDDEELKNTALDCRQCHQRGRDAPTLLMRELRGPWTHFLGTDIDDPNYQPGSEVTGRDLARDFLRAKRGEAYAGLPAAFAQHTAGAVLQNRVGSDQPLNFESEPIDAELYEATAAGRPRRSKRWDEAYEAFKRGEQLPLPHFEPRPTDAGKLAALTEAYIRYRKHELDADDLPDLSDVFPDDPQMRAEIGLQTEPGASGPDLLIQACGSCHNDMLDQSLSRARFNIALARMSQAELELAITRIELPEERSRAMPPRGTRQLDVEGKKRLIAYLKQRRRKAEDDALLDNAAALGMAADPYDMLGI
jgi:cytochrome c553